MQTGYLQNPRSRPVYPKPRLIFLFIAVASGIALLIKWKNLTHCFQREGIIVFSTLIYWGIFGFKDLVHSLDILLFLLLYIITLILNYSEAKTDSSCLDSDSIITKIVHFCYYFLFGYHLGFAIAMACLAVLQLIAICYEQYYLPWHERNLSIRGEEFDQLERVRFNRNQVEGAAERTNCYICLVEFVENEEVIRLPICNHHFHQECLKRWLHVHRVCPDCRADVKINQELLRKENKKKRGANIELQNT